MARTYREIAIEENVGNHRRSCPTMDWITMSLEARNLAYNNVEHVGPENARKKTEGWAAASQTLRGQRPAHLDLSYGNGERNKWDLYPASDRRRHASFTSTVAIGSAAARRSSLGSPRVR